MYKIVKKTICVILCACLIFACASNTAIVSAKSKAVKLNKKKVTISVGGTVSLKLKNTKKKGVWKSNNKKVATVSKKGKVKGLAAGTTKITVKVGKKKLVCKITVKANKPVVKTGDWLYTEHSNSITITGYKGTNSNAIIPGTINGKKVVEIGELAFWEDSVIKQLIIPEGVMYCGDYTFVNIRNLEMIQFPSTFVSGVYGHWSNGMFDGCKKLKKVRVKKGSSFESFVTSSFKNLVEYY